MRLISAVIIGIALLPSATIAMLMTDAGNVTFTADEVQLLKTRVKDQDDSVADLKAQVERLKLQVERYKNDSCT
jgi:hypothetical protein